MRFFLQRLLSGLVHVFFIEDASLKQYGLDCPCMDPALLRFNVHYSFAQLCSPIGDQGDLESSYLIVPHAFLSLLSRIEKTAARLDLN